MSSSIRNLHCRLRRRIDGDEGISTVEWIGLTAVVLVLLSAVIAYMQVHGGQVGAAAGSSMDEQIALWEQGGSRTSPYRQPETLGVSSLAPLSVPSVPFECPARNENAPKLSQQEIDQLIDEARTLLSQTGNGRLIQLFIDLYRIPIEFGESVGVCHFDPIRGKIVIGPAAWGAGEEDREKVVKGLALCLVHEGTHAQRTPWYVMKLGGKIGTYLLAGVYWKVVGDEEAAQDLRKFATPLVVWSYSEEYEAYKAEAEFWMELNGDKPLSEAPWYVTVIFDEDGRYRSRKDARRDIEAYYFDYYVNCLL